MKYRNALAKTLISEYYKIPDKLYKINLHMGAIALYTYLMSCAEEFNPSGTTMARALKVSRVTIHKYMLELQSRNMIKLLERGGKNKISKYQFTRITDWT